MNDIITLALLGGLAAAFPSFMLFYYRHTIPLPMIWLGIACSWAMPVIGWFVALYIATKDWGPAEDWR